MNYQSLIKRGALCTALLFITAGCVNAMKPSNPFLCEMQLVASKPYVTVQFTLINRTESPLHVLPWNSPWEGWRGRFLSVSLNGKNIEYQGPMIKRSAPTPEAFKTLNPNEKWQSQLTLNDAYLIQPGQLLINYTGMLTYHSPSSDAVEVSELDCRLEAEI